MRIEFDPAKDLANQAKHGVSLILASELDWESALVWVEQPSMPRRRALVVPRLKQDKDPKTPVRSRAYPRAWVRFSRAKPESFALS